MPEHPFPHLWDKSRDGRRRVSDLTSAGDIVANKETPHKPVRVFTKRFHNVQTALAHIEAGYLPRTDDDCDGETALRRHYELASWRSPIIDFRQLCEYQNERTAASYAQMPYADFLETDYWKTIRRYLVHLCAGYCQRCCVEVGSRRLNVHHKTYANHGKEHEHLEDLEAICRTCHEKEHGISRAK